MNDLVTKHRDYLLLLLSECTIQQVDYFWNSFIDYEADRPGEDLWQTPRETLEKGFGNCDAVAIGKYFDLIALGYTPLLDYCKVVGGPYHLRCQCGGVMLDSQDRSAETIFTFDQHTGYIAINGRPVTTQPTSKILPRWVAVQDRMKLEAAEDKPKTHRSEHGHN